MATTVTPGSIKARATAFVSLSDDVLQLAIDEAVRWISENNWGTSHYDDGVFYLACHIAEQMTSLAAASAGDTTDTLPAGPKDSESLMSWRVSYAVSEGGAFDDALATTSWGRMYLALRGRVFSPRVM